MYFNKFFVKLGIKNIVFPFVVLGYLFYVFLFRNGVNFGLERLLYYYTYPMITGVVGLGLLSTYYTGKSNEVVDYLYENKFKKFILVVISTMILSIIVFAIPLLFMLFIAATKLSFDFYLIRVMAYFSIVYFVFNLFFIVMGAFIGTIVKGYKKYIMFIVVSAFMTINMTDINTFSSGEGAFLDLINIGYDNFSTMVNYQTAVVFNREFWLDKLFPLMIVAVIVSSVYFTYHRKNKKLATVAFVSVIPIGIILTVLYGNSYIDNWGAGFEIKGNKSSQYFIDSYDINIDMLDEFKSSVMLNIYCQDGLSEDLEIRLDDEFEVGKIHLEDREIQYSRKNNTIKVNKEEIESFLTDIKRNILLKIDYSSERKNGLDLLGKDWYPLVEDSKKGFNVTCISKEPVKSNLNKIGGYYENNMYTTSFKSFDTEMYLLEESVNTLKLPYETCSYEMEMDTTSHLKNTVKVKVKNNAGGKEEMAFSLYSKLDIDYIKIQGKEVPYDRRESKIYIEEKNLPEDDFTMEVKYGGEINMRSNRMLSAYVYNRDISLVDEVIPWYPMFEDLEKDFDIKVKSDVDLFSNLENKKFDGKSTYSFKSKDKGVTLVGGNMTELKYKDYEIVLPKAFLYLGDSDMNNLLENFIEMNYLDQKKIILTSAYTENYRYKNSAILDFYLIGN